MKSKVVKLFNFLLHKKHFIKNIQSASGYYDEPKIWFYTAFPDESLQLVLDNEEFQTTKDVTTNIITHGLSFYSSQLALLKCMAEFMERLCLYTFNKKEILFAPFKKENNNALDLSLFPKGQQYKNEVIGRVQGYDLTHRKKILLPAQQVFLSYPEFFNEKQLSTYISTGCAGHFDRNQALLQGIYEIIERDAFITSYLNKIPSPLIDIKKINNNDVQLIVEHYARYNLGVYVFDITNDLQIPSFMTILTDRTGIGMAISIGLKTNLNKKKALIGSLEEAVISRPSVRYALQKGTWKKSNSPNEINDLPGRALFWSSPSMISQLDYLLNQPPKHLILRQSTPSIINDELTIITNVLKKKGYTIYCKDITLPLIKKTNFFVYKTLIPGLQPLYFREKKKEIVKKRLIEVAYFFNKKTYKVNNIPHPFL